MLKELSENRLKEIEALKVDLEESRCINGMICSSVVFSITIKIVQNEEVINELKGEILSLKEEVLEKENMLKQYLKETELKETEGNLSCSFEDH